MEKLSFEGQSELTNKKHIEMMFEQEKIKHCTKILRGVRLKCPIVGGIFNGHKVLRDVKNGKSIPVGYDFITPNDMRYNNSSSICLKNIVYAGN